jgi:hypothetical protein
MASEEQDGKVKAGRIQGKRQGGHYIRKGQERCRGQGFTFLPIISVLYFSSFPAFSRLVLPCRGFPVHCKTGKAGKLLKYRKDIIRRDRKKVKPAMSSCSTYVWL